MNSRNYFVNMKKIFVLFTALLLLISACSSEKASIKPAPLLDAETLFKQAEEKMKKKYYEEARQILETIKTQDITRKYAALAELRIGDTYFKKIHIMRLLLNTKNSLTHTRTTNTHHTHNTNWL